MAAGGGISYPLLRFSLCGALATRDTAQKILFDVHAAPFENGTSLRGE